MTETEKFREIDQIEKLLEHIYIRLYWYFKTSLFIRKTAEEYILDFVIVSENFVELRGVLTMKVNIKVIIRNQIR